MNIDTMIQELEGVNDHIGCLHGGLTRFIPASFRSANDPRYYCMRHHEFFGIRRPLRHRMIRKGRDTRARQMGMMV